MTLELFFCKEHNQLETAVQRMQETAGVGITQLKTELNSVAEVRDGDSNDDHIAALENALSVALDLVAQFVIPFEDIPEFRDYRTGALG